MQIFKEDFNSHMPFVFEDKILHCRSYGDRFLEPDSFIPHDRQTPYQNYNIWLSDIDGKNSFKVDHMLGECTIACTPTAWRDDKQVVLNFVACYITGGIFRYYKYQRRGKDLYSLGKSDRIGSRKGIPIYCESEDEYTELSVYASMNNSYLLEYNKFSKKTEKFDFSCVKYLKRAVHTDMGYILLTYETYENEIKSSIFSPRNKNIMDIKVDGKDIYKSHFHSDRIIHSVRSSGPIYKMGLHSDSYDLVASPLLGKI